MTAVPIPKTWALDEVVTAANVNAYISSVLTFLLNKPMARVRQTATQTLANNTFGTITFTVEDLDDNPDSTGNHSTSVDTGRFTAVYPGWYMFRGGVEFTANTTGFRDSRWRKNGSAVSASDCSAVAVTGGASSGLVARPTSIYLDTADYVELQAIQTSGGPLDTVASAEAASSMEGAWERLAA